MGKRFSIYRGLQKPLVFKGFKGKFIYWGLACLVMGLVLAAITVAMVSMLLGIVVLIACIGGGLFYTASQQKNGLHNKDKSQSVFVHQAYFKNKHL
ncbi:DUF4133 domain-containing protein [Pedobacter sp. MC2016-24]|uniref:DUF4133 domain-containing protein n=1 Tax=Pedobacter sp. MC2016-24 TaxID=2780090 RepID=UPI00187F00A7|nr:DUF4133 domain-containing protein [Pedobacter sp. MC2016-24]MBE9599894.1 DUF4133 domain-containing protein [Pedobacter sp. MC2016-24]